jgi:hypothetical protein
MWRLADTHMPEPWLEAEALVRSLYPLPKGK